MLPLLFNRTALAARAQCSATPRAIRSPLIARPLSTNPLSANSPASIEKSTLIRKEEAASTFKTLPQAVLRSQSDAKVPSSTPRNPLALNNLDESIRVLLPLLKAQGSVYITAHIHARPYLLTVGDTLRLPFLMPAVVPGDILRLNRASHIGSRDYTLKGAPYIDERLFECRARVLGVESEPMRVKEKTKRRQRRVKKVKSKHRYTLLKVAELKIKSLQDIGL
ncbi:MAG: hypothetical protein M1824_006308 [Vezdaea acicularis]|nr:MAG: hypothetical protein M1824_006308 [Vezdaea acicularis]